MKKTRQRRPAPEPMAQAAGYLGEHVGKAMLRDFHKLVELERFDHAVTRCAEEALRHAQNAAQLWQTRLDALGPFGPFGPFELAAVEYESRRAFLREQHRHALEWVRQAKFAVAAARTRRKGTP